MIGDSKKRERKKAAVIHNNWRAAAFFSVRFYKVFYQFFIQTISIQAVTGDLWLLFIYVFVVCQCRGPPPNLNLNQKTNSEEGILKNYKDTDYALNKYSKGIVYKFADGIVEITLEDYLRDNPDKTEVDFAAIKTLSDQIYHEQAIREHRIGRREVSLGKIKETELASVPAIDAELFHKAEEESALKAAIRFLHSKRLTEIQRRRFFQYYFQGLSTRQIARLEDVHQRAVWDSLMWAEKKLKNFFME